MAIKSIHKEKILQKGEGREDLLKEIVILKTLAFCENIIHLESVYETQHYVHLVMDQYSGGDLLQKVIKLGSYKEAEARTMME